MSTSKDEPEKDKWIENEAQIKYILSLRPKYLQRPQTIGLAEQALKKYTSALLNFEEMLEDNLKIALGEDWGHAYGGEYQQKNLWIDNPLKDIVMMALRPISLAISSAYQLITGALDIILSPLALLESQAEAKVQISNGVTRLSIGVIQALMITITPLARCFNMIVRSIHTATNALTTKQRDDLLLNGEFVESPVVRAARQAAADKSQALKLQMKDGREEGPEDDEETSLDNSLGGMNNN